MQHKLEIDESLIPSEAQLMKIRDIQNKNNSGLESRHITILIPERSKFKFEILSDEQFIYINEQNAKVYENSKGENVMRLNLLISPYPKNGFKFRITLNKESIEYCADHIISKYNYVEGDKLKLIVYQQLLQLSDPAYYLVVCPKKEFNYIYTLISIAQYYDDQANSLVYGKKYVKKSNIDYQSLIQNNAIKIRYVNDKSLEVPKFQQDFETIERLYGISIYEMKPIMIFLTNPLDSDLNPTYIYITKNNYYTYFQFEQKRKQMNVLQPYMKFYEDSQVNELATWVQSLLQKEKLTFDEFTDEYNKHINDFEYIYNKYKAENDQNKPLTETNWNLNSKFQLLNK